MLEAEVTSARRRAPWRILVMLGFALAAVGGFVVAKLSGEPSYEYDPHPTEFKAPDPAAVDREDVPALPSVDPASPTVDEPIEYVAAASDAPVIAIASGHHVWISRDDGATFTPALQNAGSIYDLSVEPSGRVYAMWGENKRWRSPGGRGGVDTIEFSLGIAEPGGHERWRSLHENLGAPLATRDGWIVGEGAPVIGRSAGESWTRLASRQHWHVWQSSIDSLHTARFFATQTDGDDCMDCGHGLTLLVAREGKPLARVWSMLDRTDFYTDQFPTNLVGCVGFGGSTLYVVARDPKGPRLMAVTDGKVVAKEALAKGLAADVSCTIAGNDRAVYMALGDDVMRIDTEELRVAPAGVLTPRGANDRDILAVDEHGYLLHVADACLWRYNESGAGHAAKLVCGTHR
jgi:hypothetical protein